MFSNAKNKLEDSRVILQQLELASDAPAFRSLFNSFLSASRAITYALQKNGEHIPGFKEWYATKQSEMKDDELLRFIHEARTDDFHEGKHRLNFSTTVHHFSTSMAGEPPSPDAKMAIGGEGVFWIVNEGTSREQRIPIKQGGDFATEASIGNPPTAHLGQPLTRNDPVAICQLALDYFSGLVHEAITTFPPPK
jgi:hypothetical protein